MNLHYFCPKCKAYLRVLEYINLTFKSKKKQGIILLHPEIGNYQFHVHDTVSFDQFEKVDFYCPVCFKNLKDTKINEKLAPFLRKNSFAFTFLDMNEVVLDLDEFLNCIFENHIKNFILSDSS